MFELPIFPLNTVLFPGMQLRLHIFEERYKLMINECLAKDAIFGVMLIQTGIEAFGELATPHLVGCSAHIVDVQRLSDGRMNIVTVGRERIRIDSLNHEKPYITASVEHYPLRESNNRVVVKAGIRLRKMIEVYLHTLGNAGQAQFDETQIPKDPKSLAYLAAILLQTDNVDKQALLSIPSFEDLLVSLIRSYRLENALLDFMLQPPDDEKFSPS